MHSSHLTFIPWNNKPLWLIDKRLIWISVINSAHFIVNLSFNIPRRFHDFQILNKNRNFLSFWENKNCLTELSDFAAQSARCTVILH